MEWWMVCVVIVVSTVCAMVFTLWIGAVVAIVRRQAGKVDKRNLRSVD